MSQQLATDKALNSAAAALSAGDVKRAARLLEAILKENPRQADALHLMGLAKFGLGDAGRAIEILERAVAIRPNDAEMLNNLGNMHKATGNMQRARDLLERAAIADPGGFAPLYNLGNALVALERFEEATETYYRALAIEPGFPELHRNLGLLLDRLGAPANAIDHLEQAVALDPDHIESHVSLGNVLFGCNRNGEALESYLRALALKPDNFVALCNVGATLAHMERYSEARAYLEEAVKSEPTCVEALNGLGSVLGYLGEFDGAIKSLKSAIALSPGYFEAQHNLAITLAEIGSYDQAIPLYRTAIELNPMSYQAHLDLGVSYARCAETEAARRSLEEAQKIEPLFWAPRWLSCLSSLKNFYASKQEMQASYQRYAEELSKLEPTLALGCDLVVDDASYALGLLQPFYLSSYASDNRDIQAQYGRIVCKIMAAKYPQWSKPLAMPVFEDGRRIKLGIVSSHFNEHSDWKMLIAGWLETLDRQQYDIFGYSTGGRVDEITDKAGRLCDHFVRGLGFENICQQIAADNLDVLIFPEIGQFPLTLRIAALRLAPVQCAGWATPQTSGLPTIDYFLSSELMEPDGADKHYCEELIRLPNLFSYYFPSTARPDKTRFADLEIRSDAVRYLCVQPPSKYLPEYDEVFARIAAQVENAQFIFVAREPSITERFQARIRRAFEQRGLDPSRYVTFLPVLTAEEFAGLCSLGHAFLDTMNFSGCVTVLDALQQDLPVVTLPGKFMRGRQSMAILKMMDVTETIADDIDGYVQTAVRLGLDSAWRAEISEKINSRRYLINHDLDAVSAFQDFLRSCVGKSVEDSQ